MNMRQIVLPSLLALSVSITVDHAACAAWSAPFGAVAEFRTGYVYERGKGVPQDYKEAMRHYQLAAAQGDLLADLRIGMLYEKGLGVEQDYKEAMRYYQAAAAGGEAMAEYRIGMLYEKGLGVPQDGAQALQWYKRAAADGDNMAANAATRLNP